ncbi:MAG TPA: CpXC domain-containing protein [Ignavibacteria bacterium]|nr:hypothetical protein [Bacteroidota bacterium]HRI84521.1 CpXC domain-containing protein [Ignavibacteria bacterium]HRJ99390.1 CpXC domain-containing protein [Ignavibacteria bacterium]
MINSKNFYLQPDKHIQEYVQKCPYCKHENKLQLITVIDLSDTLHMRYMILNDGLNKFVCMNCLYTCEMYFDMIILNSAKKYLLLFSKNREYLNRWAERFRYEQYKEKFNPDLNFLKRPVTVNMWNDLKEKIKNNDGIWVEGMLKELESIAKKDPLKFYDYIQRNKHYTDHSEMSFHIDRISNQYNLLELLLKKKFEEIDKITKTEYSAEGLKRLFSILRESNAELEEAKNIFSFTEEIFNKNDAIIIEDARTNLNVCFRNNKMINAKKEQRIINSKLKDKIEHIKYYFCVSPGRNNRDYVEFCAVDSEEEYDWINNIPDFYWVNINEEIFIYFRKMIRESADDDNIDVYSHKFLNADEIDYLFNQLEDFETALDYYPTFEIFHKVFAKIYGEEHAKYISEEYFEVWQELRDGIQLVCRQLGEYFFLCRKNNKCVWMLGV